MKMVFKLLDCLKNEIILESCDIQITTILIKNTANLMCTALKLTSEGICKSNCMCYVYHGCFSDCYTMEVKSGNHWRNSNVACNNDEPIHKVHLKIYEI